MAPSLSDDRLDTPVAAPATEEIRSSQPPGLEAVPQDILRPAVDDVGPPPDGGWQAWACIVGAWCTLFCIFGFNTSFGQLQVYYLSHQLKGYSKSEVGWISSIGVFLVSIGSIFSGRYFDSHGARTLLYTGSVLCVASMIGIAFSTQYWHFFLAHAGVGVAGMLLYAPATAIAGHWFLKRRSTAVGIAVSGSGLAGVILPIMIKELIEVLNFRDGMLIVAGFMAVLMFIACCTMKARLPSRKSPPWKALLGPWSQPRYSCLVIGSSLTMMNWISPYFNAPTYAATNHASEAIQGYAVALLQTGSFFGRVASGLLADRFGVWKTFVSMGVLSALFLYTLWTPTVLPGGVVGVGLVSYGFVSGAWITLIASSCAAISPVREVGMRIGMLWTLTAPASLAGPVICGALISANDGDFTWAAIFSGSTILMGVLITVGPVPMRWVAGSSIKRKRAKEAFAEQGLSRTQGHSVEVYDDDK